MTTLAQAVFGIAPGAFKIKVFELTEEEKRLQKMISSGWFKLTSYRYDLKKHKRKIMKTWDDVHEKVQECEQDSASMKLFLEQYGKGRFYKYFSWRIEDFDYRIKRLLGYH
jgi:hypothetical protein